MITEFRKGTEPKGYWYTFTYSNGIRATLSEYQGDLDELEALGRSLSKEKRREIRMRIHSGGRDRIHAIFRYRGRCSESDSEYGRIFNGIAPASERWSESVRGDGRRGEMPSTGRTDTNDGLSRLIVRQNHFGIE